MKREWLIKALIWAAVIAVCLLVFSLYTRPAMMVDIADFWWACVNAVK